MGFNDKKKPGRPTASQNLPDAALQARLLEKIPADGLPCELGFALAVELNLSPAEIGNLADLHDIRLTRCQLGLFGHQPHKKCIEPIPPALPEMEQAISKAQIKGRLSCADAWRIADDFERPKMEVSAACEAMKIKIRACQLGAF